MKKPFETEQVLAVGLALARFSFCCYRAAQQSIVVDEALTFNRFVKGPWSGIYGDYDANNHILYSILAKLSVGVFGLSELTLRLPSVLAGFFLIVGMFWLLQLVRSRAIRWIALLAISLHPLLMDFSIAARGYSLSLALFVWAVYFSGRGRHVLAGVLLGLGVSANLSLAFPALGAMLAAFVVAPRVRSFCATAIPAATVFFIICFAPLRTAHRDSFYLGWPTVHEALTTLIFTSIHAKVNGVGLFGTQQAAALIERFFLPLVMLFILAASGRQLLTDPDSRQRLAPLATLLATLLGLVAAHHLLDVKYPADRACLYLLLLFATAWAVASDGLRNRLLLGTQLVLACLLALQFATQLQGRYFQYWTVEMDNKAIAQLLKKECEGREENTVLVSATWVHQEALEFYRHYFHITALRPVERPDPTPLSGYDFYVLSGSDTTAIEKAQLRVLFANPLAGVVLAGRP
jgi:hypothetical protein